MNKKMNFVIDIVIFELMLLLLLLCVIVIYIKLV